MTFAALTPASLNAFDWFLVIVAAASMLMAFRRGIIKVLFSLAGLVVGILLASWNFPRLAVSLHRWVTSFAAAQVIAFLVILVGVVMIFSLLAAVVRRGVRAVGLGIVDRLLGAAFGLVRGCLLGVSVMMAMAAFFPGSVWLKNSQLAPYFLGGAHAVSLVVPKHFEEQISAGASHLLQQTPDLLQPGIQTQHP